MSYEIVIPIGSPSDPFYATDAGGWDNDGIGDANSFATLDDALDAIKWLRELGDEWDCPMRVRRIGEQYPLS